MKICLFDSVFGLRMSYDSFFLSFGIMDTQYDINETIDFIIIRYVQHTLRKASAIEQVNLARIHNLCIFNIAPKVDENKYGTNKILHLEALALLRQIVSCSMQVFQEMDLKHWLTGLVNIAENEQINRDGTCCGHIMS